MSSFILQGFEYPLMQPPLHIRSFGDYTKREARLLFEWFVGQSEPRRTLLARAVRATGGDADALDYTRQSLIPLWTWAQPFMSARPRTKAEHEAFWKGAPDWVHQIEIDDRDLTAETKCLVVDVSFYLAEVFMRARPKAQWALGTKRLGILNRPYLTSFKYALVPYDIVAGCARGTVLGESDAKDLARTHDAWLEDAP